MRYMNNEETKLVKIITSGNSIPLNPIISRFSTVSRELNKDDIKKCILCGARVYDYHNKGESTRSLNMINYNTISDVEKYNDKKNEISEKSIKNKTIENKQKEIHTLSEEDIKNDYKQPEAPDIEDESLAM